MYSSPRMMAPYRPQAPKHIFLPRILPRAADGCSRLLAGCLLGGWKEVGSTSGENGESGTPIQVQPRRNRTVLMDPSILGSLWDPKRSATHSSRVGARSPIVTGGETGQDVKATTAISRAGEVGSVPFHAWIVSSPRGADPPHDGSLAAPT